MSKVQLKIIKQGEKEKLKFEEENQPVNFQINNQKELTTSNGLNSEIENIVGLRGFVDDILTFEEALEVLNIEGARHGITFKRGNIHYFENSKLLKDKRIICAQTNRKKLRLAPKNTDSKKESIDQIKQLKAPENVKSCPVYYKFSFNKEDGKMLFNKCFETHNHPLLFSGAHLTQQMIEDLKCYNKKSKIIDMKEALEKKYNITLDYHTFYYAFRKIFPRFGDDDANNFVSMLKEKNTYILFQN